jgi:hypothetical protein
MSSKNPPEPEEQFAKSERWRHREVEALETAAGAAAGAVVGTLAGPIGMAAGAVIGAAVGAFASVTRDREEHIAAEHEKDLDSVGTDSLRDRALQAAEAKARTDAGLDQPEPVESLAEVEEELRDPKPA